MSELSAPTVYKDLSVAELGELALKLGEVSPCLNGAYAATTGSRTGRSLKIAIWLKTP